MTLRILVLLDYYVPGYKAGGPLRTVQNMVEQLGAEYQFRVVSRDRDAGDTQPFSTIVPGRWHPVGKGEAMYLTVKDIGFRGLRRVIVSTEHDVLYLNSIFSPRLTLVPLLLRRLGAIPARPVVIAPRGELHPGAMTTGSWGRWLPARLNRTPGSPRYLKKRLYLALGKALGLFRNAVWQASTDAERSHIILSIGPDATVVVAPNLAAVPRTEGSGARRVKRAGALRLVFVSRIVPKKNLHFAIQLLDGIRGEVELDIYGPLEDAGYWAECKAAIGALPPNVTVRHHGALPHEDIAPTFRDHDVLLFPTLGENFGHVILESLVQGCPVMLSDRTPWRNLEEEGAGWDLPLERPEAFRVVLQRLVEMDAREHAEWSARAASFGYRYSSNSGAIHRNRELFEFALRRGMDREDGMLHGEAVRAPVASAD